MTSPPIAAMPTTMTSAMAKRPVLRPSRSPRNILSIFVSSSKKFVVQRLQPGAQMQDGASFPSQQGVDVDAASSGHVLEALPLQFVGDEYVALTGGQLIQCNRDRLQQYGARKGGFRPAVEAGERL